MTTALVQNPATTLLTILSANAPVLAVSNALLISSSTKTPANVSAKFIKCATITNTMMKKLVIASARTNCFVLTRMFGMRNSVNVLKKNVPLKNVLQTTGGTQKPVNVSVKRRTAPTVSGLTNRPANANVNRKTVLMAIGGIKILVSVNVKRRIAPMDNGLIHKPVNVNARKKIALMDSGGTHKLANVNAKRKIVPTVSGLTNRPANANVRKKIVLMAIGGILKLANVSARRRTVLTVSGSTNKPVNANVNKKLARLDSGGMQTTAVAREVQEEAANLKIVTLHAHIIIQQLASANAGCKTAQVAKHGIWTHANVNATVLDLALLAKNGMLLTANASAFDLHHSSFSK